MPLYDFKCPTCGATREKIFKTYAESETMEVRCVAKVLPEEDGCDCSWCTRLCRTVMVKQLSAPATINVRGYNALNHYGAKQTDQTFRGSDLIGPAGTGMKVTTHEAT